MSSVPWPCTADMGSGGKTHDGPNCAPKPAAPWSFAISQPQPVDATEAKPLKCAPIAVLQRLRRFRPQCASEAVV